MQNNPLLHFFRGLLARIRPTVKVRKLSELVKAQLPPTEEKKLTIRGLAFQLCFTSLTE